MVDLLQWRASIGVWNCSCTRRIGGRPTGFTPKGRYVKMTQIVFVCLSFKAVNLPRNLDLHYQADAYGHGFPTGNSIYSNFNATRD